MASIDALQAYDAIYTLTFDAGDARSNGSFSALQSYVSSKWGLTL